MPVTIQVVERDSEPCVESKAETVDDLFRDAFPFEHRRSKSIVQSSLTRRDLRTKHILPSNNGFAWAVVRAYNSHHHLILRPDDVWLAILSQISFFINASSEELRHDNIFHKGKKSLKIEDEASQDYSDFAIMSARMVRLLQEHTSPPSFYAWMTPEFSTTTGPDIEAATILMLGTRRRYFNYKMHKKCGIPSVTLEGSREDWESILDRVQIIRQFGEALHRQPEHQWEPLHFQRMLDLVIRGIVQSFTHPESAATATFWTQMISPGAEKCGTEKLSGWIAAFCFWDEDGRCLYGDRRVSQKGCLIDGVRYHAISLDTIPSGVASFRISVNDQDELYRAEFLAGFIGVQVSSLGTIYSSASDTVQPLTGWFLSEIRTDADDEEEEAPVPKSFIYFDDFDEEAPLPAPFIYQEKDTPERDEEQCE